MSLKGSAESYIELRGSLSIPKSIQGKSAYEIALLNGFQGTEAEWLDSISKGAISEAKAHADRAGELAEEAERSAEEAKKHTSDNINKWLDEHPEATTTVQDNSLTIEKMVVGTLCYVTPEMFGAVGDGVTDDSDAVQMCIDSNALIVVASKLYKITRPIFFTKSKTIIGGGTFSATSSDTIYGMFMTSSNTNRIPYVEINNIHFESARDNEHVYPPEGHTRAEGCLASNVIFIALQNVENLYLKNTTYKNGEYSFKIHNCGNVVIDGFDSRGVSMTMYVQQNKNNHIMNGYSELYDLVGNGDHHFYICCGNDSTIIENVTMKSDQNSGLYPVHAFASDEQITTFGNNRSVIVRDCYIECSTGLFATSVSENFTVDNCHIKSIYGGSTTLFFSDVDSASYEFKNSRFDAVTISIGQGADIKSGVVCKFNNCVINADVYFADSNYPIEFTNCNLNGGTYSIFVWGANEIIFTNCRLTANGDGIISVRNNEGNVTLINCFGDNAHATKFFEYHSSFTPVVKAYNCVFPTLKLRNAENLTGQNNVFAV